MTVVAAASLAVTVTEVVVVKQEAGQELRYQISGRRKLGKIQGHPSLRNPIAHAFTVAKSWKSESGMLTDTAERRHISKNKL